MFDHVIVVLVFSSEISFVNSQTMLLKTAGPIGRPIKAEGITKHYSNLRYTVKRPIPSTAELDLAREEDFFHPEEPKPQPVLIEMVSLNFFKSLITLLNVRN